PVTPPPALQASPDLMSLLGALRRRWVGAVALGGVLAAITAGAAWYLLAPKPTGFAKLHVAFVKPNFDERAQNQNDFKTYLQTVAGKIMSRPVITAALKRDEVRRLGLENRVPDPIIYLEDNLKV